MYVQYTNQYKKVDMIIFLYFVGKVLKLHKIK